MNGAPINKFTHGLDASWLAPEAPKNTANKNPKRVNVVIIPRAYTSAFLIGFLPEVSPCWVKNETVIGIIGKTHGVNKAKNPIDAANNMNDQNPFAIALSKLVKSILITSIFVYSTKFNLSARAFPGSTIKSISTDWSIGG